MVHGVECTGEVDGHGHRPVYGLVLVQALLDVGGDVWKGSGA